MMQKIISFMSTCFPVEANPWKKLAHRLPDVIRLQKIAMDLGKMPVIRIRVLFLFCFLPLADSIKGSLYMPS